MLLKIEIPNTIAAYSQIVNYFMFAISSGRLTAGERLPSITALTERLHLSNSIVVTAGIRPTR